MEWEFFSNTRSPFTHHDFINCLCHTRKVAKTKLQWKFCCKGFCVILKACRVGCFSICEKNTCNSLINITVKCGVKLCVTTSNKTKNSIKKAVVTAKQRSCGKVMFSVMSIYHSVQGGFHVTITHDAFYLTRVTLAAPVVQGPPGPAPRSQLHK